MALDFGIIAEPLQCLSCKKWFTVLVKARKIICPYCDHRMLKIIPIKYCNCSHRNTVHVGFDQYGDTGYCTKCRCHKFENVKETFEN